MADLPDVMLDWDETFYAADNDSPLTFTFRCSCLAEGDCESASFVICHACGNTFRLPTVIPIYKHFGPLPAGSTVSTTAPMTSEFDPYD